MVAGQNGAVMKKLFLTVIVLLFATTSFADDIGLAERLFQSDQIGRALNSDVVSASAESSKDDYTNPSEMNPGKALMLSAIIPGAGQYYAGNNIRAAVFLAIEIAAWTGVVYYYNQGQDKDKEFKAYADTYYTEDIYRGVEYGLALNSEWGDSGAYSGTNDEWIEEEWDTKIHFLPDQGFTHEMPTHEDRSSNQSHDQQYYEMIGKYIHQFGFGWADFYDGEGLVEDDPATPFYDGRRQLSETYMNMRYDSNKMLDYSSYAIQIAMLNHVAAALEASFSVRTMKRNARAQVGFNQIWHNGHFVPIGGLNISW